jgi:hypothetical protein
MAFLQALPGFLIASFHPSESPLFRGRAIELSRDGNSDVSGKFAVNPVRQSTTEVTAVICP